MASTYEPIATTTLAAAAASYTFSSIPATYTDLVLISSCQVTNNNDAVRMQLNSDTAANYSNTQLAGNGTTAVSNQ